MQKLHQGVMAVSCIWLKVTERCLSNPVTFMTRTIVSCNFPSRFPSTGRYENTWLLHQLHLGLVNNN